MATTTKSNLIIPEVLADYIETKLIDKVKFAPLATIDNTLVGIGGDKIKFPKYAYIGKADVTNENGQITPVAISASSVEKQVHKLTKAVQVTDEARMSNYGNIMNEIGDQLAQSIADKQEDELLAEMGNATLIYGSQGTGIMADDIVDALELFGEDADGDKALVLSPKDLANLRKDSNYINGSEIATRIKLDGSVGDLWGCALTPSNRLKGTSTDTSRKAFIVKPSALRLINKRGVLVEMNRDYDYQRDTVWASKHYVPYLYDESKIIMMINFTAIKAVTIGIASVVGTTATNNTFITIGDVGMPIPNGYKWVYKLGSTDVTPTFGTALSQYVDWVSDTTEIACGANTKASVCLVDSANKPVYYYNLTLVKKA